MRGRPHSEEVKAQVMAALMVGQGISEVAAAHNLPYTTVAQWATGDEFVEVRSKKGERIESLSFGYLESLLVSLTEQARICGTEKYILKQSASEVAVLHGVMADKGFRLLSAIPSVRVQPDTADSDG